MKLMEMKSSNFLFSKFSSKFMFSNFFLVFFIFNNARVEMKSMENGKHLLLYQATFLLVPPKYQVKLQRK